MTTLDDGIRYGVQVRRSVGLHITQISVVSFLALALSAAVVFHPRVAFAVLVGLLWVSPIMMVAWIVSMVTVGILVTRRDVTAVPSGRITIPLCRPILPET
jgi:hypothetical protein